MGSKKIIRNIVRLKKGSGNSMDTKALRVLAEMLQNNGAYLEKKLAGLNKTYRDQIVFYFSSASVGEIACISGCSRQNMLYHIKTGKLRTFRFDNTRRMTADMILELGEYLDTHVRKKKRNRS